MRASRVSFQRQGAAGEIRTHKTVCTLIQSERASGEIQMLECKNGATAGLVPAPYKSKEHPLAGLEYKSGVYALSVRARSRRRAQSSLAPGGLAVDGLRAYDDRLAGADDHVAIQSMGREVEAAHQRPLELGIGRVAREV